MTQHNRPEEQELQVMVWYNKDDWNTLKQIFADSHLLPATYEDWLVKAEGKVKEAELSGDLVVKVTIDSVLFPAWCKEKNYRLDAEARTSFAIEAIQKQQFLSNM